MVIPMRNELSIAEDLLRNLNDSIRKNPSHVYFLVCDNCDDGSYEFLTSSERRHENIFVLNNTGKRGYGSATRLGLDFAVKKGFDWAIVIDSDLSNPLRDVSLLTHFIESDLHQISQDCVIIKGNRFNSIRSTLRSAPFPRVLLTFSANILSRILTFQISKDPTNGFRAIRLSWYGQQVWLEAGFSYILEELCGAVRTKRTVQDFATVLNFKDALRIDSSFSFDSKTANGYLKYLFLILYERVCRKNK